MDRLRFKKLPRLLLRRIGFACALVVVIAGLLYAIPTVFRFVQSAFAAAPTITSITQNRGSLTGGETVTIKGANFA